MNCSLAVAAGIRVRKQTCPSVENLAYRTTNNKTRKYGSIIAIVVQPKEIKHRKIATSACKAEKDRTYPEPRRYRYPLDIEGNESSSSVPVDYTDNNHLKISQTLRRDGRSFWHELRSEKE